MTETAPAYTLGALVARILPHDQQADATVRYLCGIISRLERRVDALQGEQAEFLTALALADAEAEHLRTAHLAATTALQAVFDLTHDTTARADHTVRYQAHYIVAQALGIESSSVQIADYYTRK